MEKVYIKDKQGNKVLPITHVSAVLDDNGNDIGSVMGAFEDEVRGLVYTPHQNYVTVATYASLPVPGSADTIYRVSNYNGSTSQVDASVYSEYAWNGSQYVFLCVKSQIGEVFDISVYNNNTKYADLTAALGTNGANVPQELRKGGMSVKFVQTSDNNYVQYRLMATTWSTTVTNWQGVDTELIAGSRNLVESGVVFESFNNIIGSSYEKNATVNVSGKTTKSTDINMTANKEYKITVKSTAAEDNPNTGLYVHNGSEFTRIATISAEDFTNGTTVFYTPTEDVVLWVRPFTTATVTVKVTYAENEPENTINGLNYSDIIDAILSESFQYSNILSNTYGIVSANIIWPDNATGTISLNYTGNLPTSISYTHIKGGITRTFVQTIIYGNDGIVSNIITEQNI